jgi:nucleotide-binding universal stress UspA family protein
MDTLLVTTDFSTASTQATNYAIALAQKLNAKLLLFHAVRLPYMDPETFIQPTEFYSIDQAKEKLRNLCESISGQVACDYLVKSGTAADEIGALLQTGSGVRQLGSLVTDRKIALIIIGTTGAGNRPDELVSSTAARLIKESICPVLVVPENAVFTDIRKIALAADLKYFSQQTLQPLLSLARSTQAEMLIVNVEKTIEELPEEKAVEAFKLENFLEEVPVSIHVEVNDDVLEGLQNFVDFHQVDMIAVIAHKYSFFESFFHQSMSRKIALHTSVPMLVLKE